MLKLRYLFPNFDLAEKALASWSHDKETLRESFSKFRISSNAVYPFYYDNKLFFLRLSPTGEKQITNILGELEFMSYLRENHYPAAEPVPSLSGETLHTIDTECGSYYACVFRGVPGLRIDQSDYSDPIIRAYGQSLGRLHRLSSVYQPNFSKWDYSEALRWCEVVLAEQDALDTVQCELRAIRKDLSVLPQNRDVYGLVHYDFEPDNVFYDFESGECHVIDFDDGMIHWFALDIEQALGELRDILNPEDSERAKAFFLEGYNEHNHLPSEFETAMPLMRRFIDLFRYTRIIRSVAESLDDEPEWMTELRNYLGSMTREYESRFEKS